MTASKEVKKVETNLPPVIDYEDEFAGEGTFTDSQYSVPPQIKILGRSSPEVITTNAAYVEGAAPGMIFLSNSQRLIKGEEGIVFQPVYFETCWQLRMGGGKFAGEFDQPQPSWEKRYVKDKNYFYYTTPDGGEAKEVLKHAGYLFLDDEMSPFYIVSGGTGIFVARKWNGMIASQRTASGKPAAIYNYLYAMKIKHRTNDKGEWGQWNINKSRRATKEEMELAKQLRKEFIDRERRMEAEEFAGPTINAEASEENPL